MSIVVRAMSITDYPLAIALWRRSDGVGLSASDEEAAIASFLERNENLSAVALSASGELVGALLCGHDGRRAYLHHLAVDAKNRRQGVASKLIAWCFDGLNALGIEKCNVFLFADNAEGAAFWGHLGWAHRVDLQVYQRKLR
jgi:putative acetyltransferase